MKILVFSDIHGSLPVARRIRALVNEADPDLVVLLGDLLYHGPRNRLPEGYSPGECAAELAWLAPRAVAVKGNCDSEVDETLLPFPLATVFAWVIDGDARKDGPLLRLCATHGHTWNAGRQPPLRAGDVLLFGHSHVPMAESHGGVHCCNPGSMALPKEGSPACYGLYDAGVFSVLTDDGKIYRRLDCR
jgi:putative phosphoesterase